MILVIDNYDSFVFNLARYGRELGAEVIVRRNDALDADGAAALAPDHVIVSPGPCGPAEAGNTVPIIQALAGRVPILGVCLGHQAIAAAFGGTVTRGRPVHGKTSAVAHDAGTPFEGVASPLAVTRYHSLIVPADGVPAQLMATARSLDDGTVMGLRHWRLPVFGVQFHPEAILTEHGYALLRNFLATGPAEAAA